MSSESDYGRGVRNYYSSSVADAVVVSKHAEIISERSDSPSVGCDKITIQQQQTPAEKKSQASSLPCVGSYFRSRGLSDRVTEVLLASWRDGTKSQYKSYIKRWCSFCSRRCTDPCNPVIAEVLEFLLSLHDSKLGYSAINTARSALSSFLPDITSGTIGNTPLVKRFLKGIFAMNPPLPRYNCIWDVEQVLKYLRSLFPLENLNLKELTLKLVMLIALTTAQRVQSLHQLKLANMTRRTGSVTFVFTDLLKQSSPKIKAPFVKLLAFSKPELCVVTTFNYYLLRTENLRNCENQLFISFVRPHRPVSRDTISRWLKSVLQSAGIDTSVFKAHSTRAASVSAANRNNVSVQEILSTAGWTNTGTFGKFYNKSLSEAASFADSVLRTS